MAKTIKPEEISLEISDILRVYEKEVQQDIEQAAQEAAQYGVDILHETSPKKTGEYASGWTYKREGERYTIYNSKRPGLTHLLENGHATVSGGRVPAKKHIKKAERATNEKFLTSVEEILKK